MLIDLSCAKEHKALGMPGPVSLQSKYLEFNSSSGAQELTYQLPPAAGSACGYQANKVLMYRKQPEWKGNKVWWPVQHMAGEKSRNQNGQQPQGTPGCDGYMGKNSGKQRCSWTLTDIRDKDIWHFPDKPRVNMALSFSESRHET